jgi:hypothetical protein
MELLFGGMSDAARFVVAFMLVLGLIGAGAFLRRRFGAGPLSGIGPRVRQHRLAVVDAAAVDGRRRLVLIRRDNTEHLIMIGGPTDVVIEPNITRGEAISVSRESHSIQNGDDSVRQPSLAEGWTQPFEPAARSMRAPEDLDATPSEPPPRTAWEAMADSMRAARSEPAAWRSPVAQLRVPPDDETSVSGLTPPPIPPDTNYHAPATPEPRRAPRPPPPYEPLFQATPPEPQRPPATPEPASQPGDAAEPKRSAAPLPRHSDENNLAEMAQRLEAALRRPIKPVEPVPPTAARPAARPEPPAARKAASVEGLNAPKGSVRSSEPLSSPPPDLKVLSGKGKAEPQPPLESLEDEMAKMLGRSPGNS